MPARLSLLGSCTIEGLGSHYEQLLRVLEDGAAVDLDLTEISRMDTAGLQLLLAFLSEMKLEGRTVSVSAVSDAVRQCAVSAGVTELLGLIEG